MSWIQNFFQKFIKDNDNEYDEYDIHNKQQIRSLPHKIIEGSHHLNTKISYQYPKGNLKLQLKSETPLEKSEKANRRKMQEQAPEMKRSESKSLPENKKILPPVQKKPFQLTEIPSPIFGFNRPSTTKEKKVVEHELSHFFDDEIEYQLGSDNHSVEPESNTETEIAASETAVGLSEVIETVIDSPVNETKVEEKTIESKNLNIPKRSPLPFNVMMLKQDRLKWEERKRTRTVPAEELQHETITKENLEVKLDSEDLVTKVEVQAGKLNDVALMDKPKEIQSEITALVDKPKELQREITAPVDKPNEIQQETNVSAVHKEEMLVEETPIELGSNVYEFPKMNLLNPPVLVEDDTAWLLYQEELLNQTLQNFNVGASVVNVTQGPAVTRFEVQPEPGVKVNKITNLSDDIKLSLAAKDIRIEAPIPGKHTIGIEVPNQKSRPVFINEIIQSPVFLESESPLTAILGLDISGKPIVTDLNKMPHGLIAGATGSGKSVCINTILVSLLFKASPDDLKLLLIDPKMVELAPYNRIPHLVSPVITDVKAATAALKWAVDEMERRYELFAHTGVRDIKKFNELAMKHKQYSDKLPFIVIIIDELADLMMMSPADVEEAISRIAQKARACGIHLIVATQRPSVDVITGLIKANIPTRIAFSVSSQVDSRTIIDISGAEKLLGRGDMLFLENGSSKPVRLQGTYVSDEEIDLVVGHVREQREPDYLFVQEELLKKAQITEDEDELFYESCEFIIEQGLASTSSLQRRFKIGYNRAARLMDMLESNGYITSANGSKPREVLITESDLESLHDTGTIN
ncbi:S-DNA-T family DNA segregation ATPase FtsK/SpoIIIE [Neobacillus niacini]|uniref:DNA translocase FtsK n=1 Tax=Neobacillus niacini TaxID=86668 RepID=UPI00285D5BCB|nr:DNA translocase FtsK [Neobacillus niacini]MDR7077757.1 S-DNA-T family DNA segregation ATPase FtsK/SpoIIIE [Neobacillus niacini]